ncbi:MAG: nucleotidyltransferase domain-containing protein [Deltaproteobacteria bacterium]|nr:nucleotidyltransferase domain-containing protein [Deltaproteobacteria bacterium]
MRTRAEIEGYAARLAEWFGERIAGLLCFGSVARGTGEQDASDIDLIAVIDGLPPLGERLLLRVDFAWDCPSRVDGVWMAPDELAGHVRAKAGYMLDALDEGVILFDREGLLERTRTALGEELARRGVVKTERWWSFPLRLGETIELG